MTERDAPSAADTLRWSLRVAINRAYEGTRNGVRNAERGQTRNGV